MNEQEYDNGRTYDNPIPKPPHELFDEFIRKTEARLVTRRFDVNSRQTIRPVNGSSDSR